jgi:hypothetical protein
MPTIPKTPNAAGERPSGQPISAGAASSKQGINYQIWCFDWIAVLFEGKTGAAVIGKINDLLFKLVMNFYRDRPDSLR